MKWRGMTESEAESFAGRTMESVLAERRAAIQQYVPAETNAIHARAVEELRASGIADRALRVGDKAPSFDLLDHASKPVSSAALLDRGPLVAVFFRGRWCPFCVAQLEMLNQHFGEISVAGASLVAISPMTVKQCDFAHDQHHLRFPVLSDHGNAVARRFGIVYRVPDYQQKVYASVFVNLPFINGESSWELPIPATFVIGVDGTVCFASADPDYTRRPEIGEVLQAVRKADSARNGSW